MPARAAMRAKVASAPSPARAATEVPLVSLGPLPAAEADIAPKSAAKPGEAAVRQIGGGRPVAAATDPEATAGLLNWRRGVDGAHAAAVRFRSDGAASVRLGLLVRRLPDAAAVRVQAPGGGDLAEFSGAQIQAVLARNAHAGERGAAASTFWLPAVGGPEAMLEIALPPGVTPAEVEVAVPHLSHLWVDLARGNDDFLKVGEAGGCNLDASCEVDYLNESRAVALMEFVSGTGIASSCTGTLMADVAASGTPWFLSARHCIDGQAAASTLVTYWFYKSSACNSGALGPAVTRLIGGATLLHTSARTDIAFMRLHDEPPAGALFAGSLLAAPTIGTTIAGLHHPKSDLLKFSLGSIQAYARCVIGSSCTEQDGADDAGFLSVRWSRGITEKGSSGSSIFATIDARKYVSGHLFAGLASCTRPGEADYYGRLDMAYRDALYQWLGEVPGGR